MKKFAICCLALFVAVMLVPSAQAATKCYSFPSFCDHIQVSQFAVGGIQKQEVIGLWDWLCINAGDGTPVVGGPNKFGTEATYPYHNGTGYLAANFNFQPSSGLFDLYGTFDGVTLTQFQAGQAFTVAKGACNPLGPKSAAKPLINRQ